MVRQIRFTAVLLVGVCVLMNARSGLSVPPGTWAVVGTYSEESNPGSFVFRFDTSSGQLESASAVRGIRNPSFLAVHRSKPWVYAVSEIGQFDGRRTGAVAALEWNSTSETLKLLNLEASGGDGPCHVSIDPTGRAVLVAHYAGGSVAALPILPDGKVAPVSSFVQHSGSSTHPRQTAPHAHSIYPTPDEKFVVSADLGIDRVLVYRWDSDSLRLLQHQPPSVAVPPGSGPRHLAFHPSGRTAYVINELSNTIGVLGYRSEEGRFELRQVVSTLPTDYEGTSYTAEVVVHPTGRWVLGSNRGHDSLTVFRVNDVTGELSVVGYFPTGGKTPRNFAFDPTGSFVLAANQNSDKIVVFRFDPNRGQLESTGVEAAVPKPVCVRWLVGIANG